MLSLKIFKPMEVLEDLKAENITLSTKMGEIGIFPGHMRLLTQLEIGKMQLEIKQHIRIFAISGGIAKVNKNEVEIFTFTTEEKDEIDIERARRAKERAEEYIKRALTEKNINLARAENSLKRALNRIRVAQL